MRLVHNLNEAINPRLPKNIGKFVLTSQNKNYCRYDINIKNFIEGDFGIKFNTDGYISDIDFTLIDTGLGVDVYAGTSYRFSASVSIDDVLNIIRHTSDQIVDAAKICEQVYNEIMNDPGLIASTLNSTGQIIHSYGEFGRPVRLFKEKCSAIENDLTNNLKKLD